MDGEDGKLELGYLDDGSTEQLSGPAEDAFGPPDVAPEAVVLELDHPIRAPGQLYDPAASYSAGAPHTAQDNPRAEQHPASGVANFVAWLIAGSLGIAASLLTRRYQLRLRATGLPLVFGTVACGFLQLVLAIFLTIYFYGNYQDEVMRGLTPMFENDLFDPGIVGLGHKKHMMAVGAAGWIGFLLFSVAGWLCMYVFVEGLLRFAGALAVGEPVATGPVWLVERVEDLIARARVRWQNGPLVADQLERRGDTVIITSCRPRDWTDWLTIEHDGTFYCVERREVLENRGRRFRYTLAVEPKGRPMRRVHHYRIDELVPKRPPGTAPSVE